MTALRVRLPDGSNHLRKFRSAAPLQVADCGYLGFDCSSVLASGACVSKLCIAQFPSAAPLQVAISRACLHAHHAYMLSLVIKVAAIAMVCRALFLGRTASRLPLHLMQGQWHQHLPCSAWTHAYPPVGRCHLL